MDLFGRAVDFDLDAGILTFQLAFFDENNLQDIERLIKDGTMRKMILAGTRLNYDSMSYEQQKKWFVSVKLIIEHHNGVPSGENILLLHKELKKDIFPVRMKSIGDIEIPSIPSIRDLSWEELNGCIQELHERYEQLNINFDI